MTPFESEMLQTAWPVLSSVLGGAAVWYLKTLSKSLSDLAQALDALKQHIAKVENEIKTDLSEFKRENQHRLDRIIGNSNARMGKIETVCSMQHGVTFRRRAGDLDPDWSQDSDVSGDNKRCDN